MARVARIKVAVRMARMAIRMARMARIKWGIMKWPFAGNGTMAIT